jgi:hypothetical protein
MSLLQILTTITDASETQGLHLSARQIRKLAERQYSREQQAVSANLGGALPYVDRTGDTAVSNVLRAGRRRATR